MASYMYNRSRLRKIVMNCTCMYIVSCVYINKMYMYTLYIPHTYDQVYVASDSFSVSREQVGFSGLLSRVQHDGFHFMVYLIQILKWINIRDITRVQDVIDVLQE